MKRLGRKWILCALAGLLVASGCARDRRHAEDNSQSQTGEGQRSNRSETPATGDKAPGDTASSGDVNDLFSRIHEHESELSQTISAGEWEEVGPRAFRIRDLLVTAASRADLPADRRGALEQSVSEVKRLATDLSRAGNAHDLDKAKALNSELQNELTVIERMVAQARGANSGTQ